MSICTLTARLIRLLRRLRTQLSLFTLLGFTLLGPQAPAIGEADCPS